MCIYNSEEQATIYNLNNVTSLDAKRKYCKDFSRCKACNADDVFERGWQQISAGNLEYNGVD